MTTGADGGKTTSDYLLRGRRPPPPRKRTQNLAEGGAGDEDGHDQQEVVSPTKVVGGLGVGVGSAGRGTWRPQAPTPGRIMHVGAAALASPPIRVSPPKPTLGGGTPISGEGRPVGPTPRRARIKAEAARHTHVVEGDAGTPVSRGAGAVAGGSVGGGETWDGGGGGGGGETSGGGFDKNNESAADDALGQPANDPPEPAPVGDDAEDVPLRGDDAPLRGGDARPQLTRGKSYTSQRPVPVHIPATPSPTPSHIGQAAQQSGKLVVDSGDYSGMLLCENSETNVAADYTSGL